MREKDLSEVIQSYDGFVKILQQLSMSAESQICKLKGTAVADELASDFSEIGMLYAKNLLRYGWITEEQYELSQEIDELLEQMTQKKELWNDSALLCSVEWENCRKKGIELLQTLETQ